jgi:hypothetical protein
MSKKSFTVDAAVFAEIHDTEVFSKNVSDENKERTAEKNERKITAYAGLIASINGVKLVNGNLPKYARDKVWEGLTVDAGVSKAVAKKYLENSVGAVRPSIFDFPTQATAAHIEARLIEDGIDSEAKLAKRVKPEDVDTPEARIARDFVGGFTTRKDENGNRVPGVFKLGKYVDGDDPFAAVERLRQALDEAQRIARAATEAAAAADVERATFEEVMAALD